MARPSKPVIVLEMEGRSHRTKEELKTRQAGEAKTLSGLRLSERPEVKADAAAHREFLRLKKLLGAMEKDDAAYTGIINRYCQIYAECLSLSERRERFELGAKISGMGMAAEKLKPDSIMNCCATCRRTSTLWIKLRIPSGRCCSRLKKNAV